MDRTTRVVLLVFLLLWGSIHVGHGQNSSSDPSSPYPILFIHGLASSSDTWQVALDTLDDVWGMHRPVNAVTTRGHECHAIVNAYEEETARVGPDGTGGTIDDDVLIPNVTASFPAGQINQLESGSLYTLNLRNFWNEDPAAPQFLIDSDAEPGSFGSSESKSNESAIVKSGFALEACIDQILVANPGVERVILVGHSLGGLIAREYLQRTVGQDDPAVHRVARLVTIGTPHRGSQSFEVQPPVPPNASDASKGSVASVYAEAVRDLRYWYRSDNQNLPVTAGLYLFGGNEEDQTFRSIAFHNHDVDANGAANDDIAGINAPGSPNPWDGFVDNPALPLPTTGIEYVWIVSSNDGVVDFHRQRLFPSRGTALYEATEIQQISTPHLSQTEDVVALTNGLDEPDVRERAYTISAETVYAGHTTRHGFSGEDQDWYVVDVPEPALLRLVYARSDAAQPSLRRASVYDDQGRELARGQVDSAIDTLDVAVDPGRVYVNIVGQSATPAPYTFRVELDTSVRVDIQSADAALRLVPGYPYVTASVEVTQGGVPINNLTGPDFFVNEEGNPLRFFTVTPPSQGGTRLADIVFIVDNSGSMGDEQDDVENNIRAFVDALAAENVDFALGLVRYGDRTARPVVEDEGTLTTDAAYFTTDVLSRNQLSGGTEPGYLAITAAVNQIAFRSGSQKVFVIATDETPAQLIGEASEDDALQALLRADVTLYASTTANLVSTFQRLTGPTGGQVFDIFADFSSIAQAITTQVSSTYVVTYRSPGLFGGSVGGRELVIGVNAPDGSDQDTTRYDPSRRPLAAPTSATQSIARSGRPANTAQTIGVEVASFSETPLQSVELFYRLVGSNSAYATVPMAENPDSTALARKQTSLQARIFEADIPASVMQSPGVEYFVRLSDGETTVSVPNTDPQRRPYQLAVLPNTPPQIDHRVPAFLSPGTPLPIVAAVSDTTAALDVVTLFYRERGEITYQTVEMSPVDSVQYQAEIPGDVVTAAGIDYFIEATDVPSGIAATRGTPDRPLSIGGASDSPTPRIPAEDAIGIPVQVAFQWDRVDGMTGYEMEVSTSRAFDRNVQRFTRTDTSLTVPGLTSGATYYWRVRSQALIGGFTPWSAPSPFSTYATQLDISVSQDFGDPKMSESYRLVALPGSGNRPIAPMLVGEAGTDWAVYADDGNDQDFLIPFDGSALFAFQPGNGFWMLSSSPWSYDESDATAVDLLTTGETIIPLQDGWNIISNPLDRDISWSRVSEANGGSLQDIWRFDGRFRQATTFPSAASGEAVYFLNTTGQSELRLPYSTGLTYRPETTDQQAPDGFFTLSAVSTLDERASPIQVGHSPDAERFLDALDLIAPPAAFEPASLRIRAERASGAKAEGPVSRSTSLARDVRPVSADGERYTLELTTRRPHLVTIVARGMEYVGNDEVVLFIPSTGKTVDLRETPSFAFRPSSATTTLHMIVGDASFVKTETTNLIPETVAFHAPYPNPVHTQVTLAFDLPTPEHVRIDAYDILGRRVATLLDRRFTAGSHNVPWTPGPQLASGAYFLRFVTSTHSYTRKMTLLR